MATRSIGAPVIASRKLSAKPQQSVLWPSLLLPPNTTVFTAPIVRASGDNASSTGTTACLKGWVTLRPLEPGRLRGRDHVADRGVRKPEPVEIEQKIRIVDAEASGLAFVHTRRARGLNATSDQANHDLVAAMPGGALVFGRKTAEKVDKTVAHSRSFLPCEMLCGPRLLGLEHPLSSRETRR